MTLIELLVSIAILTVIGASIAGAFAIAFKVLAPGGAQASLTGNHDLLSFEQQIGADVARAACLRVQSGSSPLTLPSGGCTRSVNAATSTCGTGAYVLCLGWYAPGNSTCHTAVYSQMATTDVIQRTDNVGSQRISTGGLGTVTASWSAASLVTVNGYQWTKQVDVVVSQTGAPDAASRPATWTFHMIPLLADPLSPAVPSVNSSPC